MIQNRTTPTTRTHNSELFEELVRTEQALLRGLARQPEALARALGFAREASSKGQLGQLLPTTDKAQERAIMEALDDVASEKKISVPHVCRIMSAARVTRKALAHLAEGPQSDLVRKLIWDTMEARNRLLVANQGLLRSRVAHWRKRGSGCQIEGFHEEAVQEGCLALMGAIDRFQPRLGLALSSYAMTGIDAAIGGIRYSLRGNIRLSDGVRSKLKRLLEAENKLLMSNQRAPTLQETAEIAKMTLGEATFVYQAAQSEERLNLTPDEAVRYKLSSPQEQASRDADTRSDNKFRSIQIRQALQRGLRELPVVQARIIALRFGVETDAMGEAMRTKVQAQRIGKADVIADDACKPSEIAKVMNMPLAEVSQLQTWGFKALRQLLGRPLALELLHA